MATLGRILSWWGQDYAYAAYWQVRGTLRPGKRDALQDGTERPVLIVPGVWEPWGFLGPVIDALHKAGHPVHVIPALGRNSRPVEDTARVVAKYLDEHDLHDVVIVAHSKGGLIGKFVMSELDPNERITSMVAICTPFAGSDYARFMMMRTLRAFSPDDPTTVRMGRNLEVNARITTITGVFDPHIPRIVALEGATNITVEDGGHFRLLDSPDVIDIVLDVAGRPAVVQEQIVDETVAAAATDAPAPPATPDTGIPIPPDADVERGATPETPSVP
ncbi:alpha/beta fold hydrolase [Microbacterium sp. 4R-513]|uniref:esterase/lipase family protein n=1 Tax=Microbacterium sp. 4R-513 TaxID=2567934 RepID=UPI0019D0AFE7|nr:alpha/beta fold hydrolase [Microbacterium sp. 4R-513]